jgi:hypothetical protein
MLSSALPTRIPGILFKNTTYLLIKRLSRILIVAGVNQCGYSGFAAVHFL